MKHLRRTVFILYYAAVLGLALGLFMRSCHAVSRNKTQSIIAEKHSQK